MTPSGSPGQGRGPATFEELVRHTSRLVYARLLDTGHAQRAEDLLQETYLLAYRSLGKLSDPAGFRSWLLAIAHNVTIDAARHDARQKRAAPESVETSLAVVPATGLPPEDEAHREDLRAKVLGRAPLAPRRAPPALTCDISSGPTTRPSAPSSA